MGVTNGIPILNQDLRHCKIQIPMDPTKVGDFFRANVVFGKGDNTREMKMCFDLYDSMRDVV